MTDDTTDAPPMASDEPQRHDVGRPADALVEAFLTMQDALTRLRSDMEASGLRIPLPADSRKEKAPGDPESKETWSQATTENTSASTGNTLPQRRLPSQQHPHGPSRHTSSPSQRQETSRDPPPSVASAPSVNSTVAIGPSQGRARHTLAVSSPSSEGRREFKGLMRQGTLFNLAQEIEKEATTNHSDTDEDGDSDGGDAVGPMRGGGGSRPHKGGAFRPGKRRGSSLEDWLTTTENEEHKGASAAVLKRINAENLADAAENTSRNVKSLWNRAKFKTRGMLALRDTAEEARSQQQQTLGGLAALAKAAKAKEQAAATTVAAESTPSEQENTSAAAQCVEPTEKALATTTTTTTPTENCTPSQSAGATEAAAAAAAVGTAPEVVVTAAPGTAASHQPQHQKVHSPPPTTRASPEEKQKEDGGGPSESRTLSTGATPQQLREYDQHPRFGQTDAERADDAEAGPQPSEKSMPKPKQAAVALPTLAAGGAGRARGGRRASLSHVAMAATLANQARVRRAAAAARVAPLEEEEKEEAELNVGAKGRAALYEVGESKHESESDSDCDRSAGGGDENQAADGDAAPAPAGIKGFGGWMQRGDRKGKRSGRGFPQVKSVAGMFTSSPISPTKLMRQFDSGSNVNSIMDRIPLRVRAVGRRLSRGLNSVAYRHTTVGVDQTVFSGLEMYLDATYDQKELVIQSSWPWVALLPDSLAITVWQTIIAVATIVTSIATPLDSVFLGGDASNSILGAWENLLLAIFIADIWVNFSTGVTDLKGHVQLNGRTIAWRYIRSPWFTLDVVSVLPFDSMIGNSGPGTQTAKALKLLKLARLNKVLRRADAFFEMGAFQLIILMGAVGLLIHWVSCGWRFMGCSWLRLLAVNMGIADGVDDSNGGDDGSGSGFDPDQACREHTDILQVYGLCFFQASTNLFGGSAVATNIDEQLYFGIVVILGAVIQASVFGSIAKSMAQMDEDRHLFDQKMEKISSRMRFLHVPKHLQDKVIKFYENSWNIHHGDGAADSFIDSLSPALRGEMRLALYRKMLMKMPYLRKMEVVMAERLVQSLRPQSFLKGDLIIRLGEPGDWLGFVELGTAAVLDPGTSELPLEERRVLRVLEVGDYFGEVSLFFGTRRTADIVAMTWATIQILDRRAWDGLRADFGDEMKVLEAAIAQDTGSWMRNARRQSAFNKSMAQEQKLAHELASRKSANTA